MTTAPDTPVRQVMQAFNTVNYPFRLVCDAAGRLLGTITDGDVRRGLLSGLNIDSPASACMHRNPITARVGDRWEDIDRPRGVNFIPVIDAEGVVRHVMVASAEAEPIASALIMAGGLGRRLGERTRNTPKPLLPVRGKPILEHILLQLEEAMVPQIYVSVHYLHEKIESFLRMRKSRSRIELVHETDLRGTAGALALLPKRISEPILVMNADVITDVNLQAMAQFHSEHANDATIGMAAYDCEIPFGVIRHDDRGAFSGIDEKPVKRFPVAAGIYILSPSIVAVMPRGRRIDMPDLLMMGMRMGLRIGTFPIHEYWIDVGHPEDLAAAERPRIATIE